MMGFTGFSPPCNNYYIRTPRPYSTVLTLSPAAPIGFGGQRRNPKLRLDIPPSLIGVEFVKSGILLIIIIIIILF
jgi:hypothetical protein